MNNAILAHGSGVDDLVVFGISAVIALGIWLRIRQKPDEEEEIEGDSPEPR
jgi:hypothetical protein